ncbi:hypothetical protein DXG01_013355 [Tephrocybe rancida]|nr:hypothetical protein DXG01_013355 [Tephrocybe rancida]
MSDIVSAARQGGSTDPLKNLHLAAVLKRAKDMDVPKENIEKALAKASRGKDQSGNAFVYEALVFNSVGLIIECATDNNNRTIQTLREILNGYGYSTFNLPQEQRLICTQHSARQAPVKFMFKRMGYMTVSLSPQAEAVESDSQDELVETALTNGAIDFDSVADTLRPNVPSFWTWSVGISELRYMPLQDGPDISNEAKDELKALVEELEDNDDVLQVWATSTADS